MDIVTIDFETYYDDEYSLRKLTTEAYVRDPRFEVLGVSVKINDAPTDWYSGSDPGKFLSSLDYSDKAILCHNTAFDGAILSWHYGIRPRLWLDTLSMARPFNALITGCSLAALSGYYRLGRKGDELLRTKGKHRGDFSPQEMDALANYAIGDAELTYKLFKVLRKKLPAQELITIDQTIRMYTEPVFELDTEVLDAHLEAIQARKKKFFDRLGGEEKAKKTLMSNAKFAKLLEALGATVPMKTSKTTGKQTFAFAKTDKEFLALREHPKAAVRAVVEARLGTKSTIEESRTKAFQAIASRGPLPIMLNYYGAHCVPGDTEVLTPSGWERLDKWAGGAVAQWRPDGSIEFLQASRYTGPVIDKWVVSSAPYMPVDMTLGHTVPVLGHRGRKLMPMPAEQMTHRGSSYIPNAGNLVHSPSITPEQTRVLVMVQADGSFEENKAYGRKLSLFLKKTRKIQRARELLAAAGVKYEEQEYPSWPGYVRFIVRARDYPTWLIPERKVFGPWILDCPLDVLLDELKYWDGWMQGGQVCYSTSDIANAEWVQTAAHLAGMGCAISRREGKGNRRDNYALRLRKRAECMVHKHHLQVKDKRQRAYCVESTTGYWLARANGHIFVTGNTGRFSGGDKVNLQNLPRGGALRKAIAAPDGMTVVACDSSQIEARLVAYLAGQTDLLNSFREKRDVYSEFATDVFNRKITKADKVERHVGKTAILGLGYGMGPDRFKDTLETGFIPVKLDINTCRGIVSLYRNKNHRIQALWNRCDHALGDMSRGGSGVICDLLSYEENRILLPNGLHIQYPGLRPATGPEEGRGYRYINNARAYTTLAKRRLRGESVTDGIAWTGIYGGKVVENVTQAVARIVITEQMAVIGQRYHVALQVHDEVVCVVPEEEAEDCMAYMMEVMSTPPKWAPDLPVACEAGMGPNYGEAK